MAAMQQPIEDRDGDDLINEHLAPLHDGAVGSDQHAVVLITAGDQLEKQVGHVGLQQQGSQFSWQ